MRQKRYELRHAQLIGTVFFIRDANTNNCGLCEPIDLRHYGPEFSSDGPRLSGRVQSPAFICLQGVAAYISAEAAFESLESPVFLLSTRARILCKRQ